MVEGKGGLIIPCKLLLLAKLPVEREPSVCSPVSVDIDRTYGVAACCGIVGTRCGKRMVCTLIAQVEVIEAAVLAAGGDVE
ncbi:MAG: hypothetical protein ACLS29_02515 [Prevotellamassilia sp.]